MDPAEETAVVDSKQKARHIALGLTDDTVLEMYYKLAQARGVDEKMWVLHRQGKIHFLISCQGQEGIQVGSAFALRRGKDFVLPYYRDIGVVLVLGMTSRDIMLSAFARDADPASGGRQMPGHFGYPSLHIITGSSPVATQLPHAAGIALASKLRKDDAVTVVHFGEGATSKGDWHEALNFAGIHKLPVVFICENNGYAISEPQAEEMAIKNVADRAAGYGFPGVTVDGNDVLASYETTKEAVDRARRGEGPTLIEAKTFRVVPHSSDDDDRRYRSREEVEEWKKRDPVQRFKRYLEEQGLLNATIEEQIRERIAQEIEEAVDFAVKSPLPRPEDLTKYVYSNG
ncbi:MAG: thiamine pyrophosphate-dependent dehydrogenase E1 component subunit alpha [Chloroflexi bacterium]|nr:thiamine pyrophosphate-dependent dehydrogenase E1 component subunit alpha [Chloroflexota bacterium]